jgi:hypothetical protein
MPNTTSNKQFQSVYQSTVPAGGTNLAPRTVAQQIRTAVPTSTDPEVFMNSLSVGTTHIGVPGEILATKNITAYYSDERLKTRLGDVEDALQRVRALSAFYYQANETAAELGYDPAVREVGVSAQEVQQQLPEAVAPAPVDPEYLTVRYERLVPLLIAAIQELDLQVQEIRRGIK